MPYIWVFGLIN